MIFRNFLSKIFRKSKMSYAPHQSLSATAFPPRGSLWKRLTIFAEKMKFAEFFQARGSQVNKAINIAFPSGGRWQGVALTNEGQFATERQPGVAARRRMRGVTCFLLPLFAHTFYA